MKQFETRPSILSRLFAKHLVAVVVEGQSFENSDVTSLAASRGAIGVALFASMFNQRLCLPTTEAPLCSSARAWTTGKASSQSRDRVTYEDHVSGRR